MIFIPDAQLDLWLLEDIQGGDLTCRALGIGGQRGRMTFIHRQGGCVSALALAQRMLKRLDLHIEYAVSDGEVVAAGASLLCATGQAAALHQGWKAVQNLLEWQIMFISYANGCNVMWHTGRSPVPVKSSPAPGCCRCRRCWTVAALFIVQDARKRCCCSPTIAVFTLSHRAGRR